MKYKYYVFSLPLFVKGMKPIAMQVTPPIIAETITVLLRPHLYIMKINIIPLNLLL